MMKLFAAFLFLIISGSQAAIASSDSDDGFFAGVVDIFEDLHEEVGREDLSRYNCQLRHVDDTSSAQQQCCHDGYALGIFSISQRNAGRGDCTGNSVCGQARAQVRNICNNAQAYPAFLDAWGRGIEDGNSRSGTYVTPWLVELPRREGPTGG